MESRTASAQNGKRPKAIVCVYSQRDELWYRELQAYLAVWQNRGDIYWADRASLDQADLILLLISPSFLAATVCHMAMARALEIQAKGKIPVVPVLARASDWKESDCGGLTALPGDGRPIAEWEYKERAYENICAGLAWLLRLPNFSALGIASPERPLLFQARDLPEEGYVLRPKIFDEIKYLLLNHQRTSTTVTSVALRGAGGIGKTTLALALCHDREIQAAFPDGILWVELGEQSSRPLDVLNGLLISLEESHTAAITLQEARERWKRALRDCIYLVVIDDVWQADALRPLLEGGPHCVSLITTRNDQLLPEDTQRILIDVMEPREALAVLSRALPEEIKQPTYQARLTDLMERLGRWPLLLRLANGMILQFVKHRKSLESALTSTEEAYQTRGITAFRQDNVDERQRTMDACLEVSVEHLQIFASRHYSAIDCYQELVIFPEDVDIPIATLEILWKGSAGLQRWETEELCLILYDLSLLLICDLGTGTIRLHDVVRSYLVQRAKDQMPAMHLSLLRAYRQEFRLNRWTGLPPDDRYIWRHLIYHLCHAGYIDAPPSPLTDLGYLIREALYAGVSALEADLLLASTCSSNATHLVALHRTVARISHLLRQVHSPAEMGGLLLSHLGWEFTFKDQRPALEQELPRPFLTAWYPLPDQSVFALFRTLPGHIESVSGCAVSPDGRFIVSSSWDRTLKVWNAATGTERFTLSGYVVGVTSCAISPDGRFIVSSSWSSMLKVWDVATGTERFTLSGHTNPVWGCAVSPDSRLIVSASEDCTLKVWDVATGTERFTLSGHSSRVNGCAVSPDGRFIVSTSVDKTLKVWDVATGTERFTLSGHTNSVSNCAVSPDSRLIVSASDDMTLKVWDTATGTERFTLSGHTNRVNGCTVTPDGRFVVSASWDGTLKVWDMTTGMERFTLSGHTQGVTGCAVSPDGSFIVSSSADKTLKVWNLAIEAEPRTLSGQSNWVKGCAVSPDGRFIVSASWDHTLTVWDAATGKERQTLSGHSNEVNGCVVSPDSRFILSASDDFSLKVWNAVTGVERRTLPSYVPVRCCAMSPDGRFIVSGSEIGTLTIWDAATGKERQTLSGHSNWVRGCAVSPDGHFIVSASEDHTLKIWDVASRKERRTLSGHLLGVTSCAVSSDSRFIVSASEDKTLKVWDMTTGEARLTLSGHTSLVKGCVVSPNGRYILSVSSDNTLKVWEAQMGQCLLTFPVDAALTGCAFHHDGEHLVACGTQGVYFLRLVV